MSTNEADFEVKVTDNASGPAGKAAGGIRGLLDSMGGAEKAGEGLHRVLEFALGGVLKDVGEKVLEMGKELAAGAVELAVFGDESRDAFRNITGSAAAGEAAFSAARTAAMQLGLDINTTAGQFQQLMRIGLSQSQADNLVRMGADMKTLGVSAEKVDGVMSALSRMQAKGALDSRAMMELAGAGLKTGEVYSHLATTLGISEDSVKKLAAAGKISAAQGLEAIQDVMKKQLGVREFGEKAREDAEGSLGGMMNVIKAKVQNLGINVGDALRPGMTKATEAIGHLFDSITSSPAAGGIIKMIGGAMETIGKVAEHVGPMLSAFFGGATHGAGGLMPLISKLGDSLVKAFSDPATIGAMRAIGEHVGKLVGVVGVLVVGALRLIPPFIEIAGVAYTLLSPIMDLTIAIGGGLVHAIDSVAGWITAIIPTVQGWANVMQQAGSDFVDGFVRGITGAIGRAAHAASDMAKGAWNAVTGFFDMHSPSRKMMKGGGDVAEGLGLGMVASIPRVQRAANDVASAAVPQVATAAAKLSTPGAGAPAKSGGKSAPVLNIHVQMPHGATAKDGEAFGTAAGVAFRREAASFFEDLSATG